MATGPRLIIDIAEKRFDSDVALFKTLCVDIAPSSVVALIGPSGIGKSTLLRMLAGIDQRFVGNIQVDGLPAAQAPTPGFVFQDPRLLPWLTVAENIRAARTTCTADEVSQALAWIGLEQAANVYPHQLSGGMQRRVALARALVVNAGLLLLDEPFVWLDRVLVIEMHNLFARLIAKARPTVVFVSHLTDDAARLADRVILLDHRPARIVADIALGVPVSDRDDAMLSDYRSMLDAYFGAPK